MVRRVLVALGAVAAAWLGAAALAGNAAAATIGQTFTPDPFACFGPAVVFQTGVADGRSYTVPAGRWRITEWSTQAGANVDQLALVVGRPTDNPGEYKIVGSSSTQTPTPNRVNTYSTSILVRGGDVLGFWFDGNQDCAVQTGSAGDTYAIAIEAPSSPPSSGDTESTLNLDGYRLDVSAALAPFDADELLNHVYVCYSKWEHDGGLVASSDVAAALLAAGGWLPAALPGNVPGGENIGAYHLDCNPPPTEQPTNMWVGDGGDVVTVPREDDYLIYT